MSEPDTPTTPGDTVRNQPAQPGPSSKSEARRLAAARASTRRRRINTIRRRVAIGTVTLFLGLAGVIVAQMAAGEDSALLRSSARNTATSSVTSQSASAAGSGSTSEGSTTGSDSSSESGASSSEGTTAITTGQS